MGFTLSVKGQDTINLGTDVIISAHVGVSTPFTSMAKSTNVSATLWVTGKLTSTNLPLGMEAVVNNDTAKLLNWSLVPAQNADAYRDVTVEVITAGQTFRMIHFPNAFVVDYNERYIDTAGVGEFTLVLRQKADKFSEVTATEGQSLGK
jgi:hypothetical protein